MYASLRHCALAIGAVIGSAAGASAAITFGASLPPTCAAGDKVILDSPLAMAFECIGSDTWRPSGPSPLLAIKKGVNLNAANVDIPLGMPGVRYYAQKIRVLDASTNLSTTAARIGIWTGAGATGANIVTAASSQAVLQALTSPASVQDGNLGVSVTSTLTQVFLRVTVAHGSPATVTVIVYGDIIP